MAVKYLAFDMDGVIFSSESFIGDAYREAIINSGLELHIPSSAEIIEQVGKPITLIFQSLFKNITPEEIAVLHKTTLLSIVKMIYEGRGEIFNQIPDVIKQLSRNYRLFICSNGRRKYSESILDKHELKSYFHIVLSLEDLLLKTKGELLNAYIEDQNSEPGEWIMIGDRRSDIDAAHFAGCKFIGCKWGHGHLCEIEKADILCDSPSELPAAIKKLNSNL